MYAQIQGTHRRAAAFSADSARGGGKRVAFNIAIASSPVNPFSRCFRFFFKRTVTPCATLVERSCC